MVAERRTFAAGSQQETILEGLSCRGSVSVPSRTTNIAEEVTGNWLQTAEAKIHRLLVTQIARTIAKGK